MKALSVKQPWAWALFHGKDVENRTWATKFRGELLIHASKTFDYKGYTWLRTHSYLLDDTFLKMTKNLTYFNLYDFSLGCIIGKVTMIDCAVHHPDEWFFGPYGFTFENPVELKKPIPFKGALKFFDVPDELLKGFV